MHHQYQHHQWQICDQCQRQRRQIAAGVNDTGGKFVTSINDTGGKFFQIATVKRPKFDILFGENIFFLQNLFRWPPLNFFRGVSKIQFYGKMKWKIPIFTLQGRQKNTFLQMSNLGLLCLTSSPRRADHRLGSMEQPPWPQDKHLWFQGEPTWPQGEPPCLQCEHGSSASIHGLY